MAKIKQTMNCGCLVAVDYNNMVIIDYCPKHKAAPELYEVLKEAKERYGNYDPFWCIKVFGLLAKAEGK